MRIRWKLSILLLAISVIPLGTALWIERRAALGLGEELARKTREWLTDQAKRDLLQAVRDHGRLLRHQVDELAYNVRIQAQAVERCLAADPPHSAVIHFAHEFEDGGGLTDLVASKKHPRVAADGRTIPMRVSYEQQDFVLAPGAERAEVADDLARLSGVLSTYQLVHQSQSEFINWQFTALESGVHSSFPGHGYYPEGFDPRRRAWYRNARARGALTWSEPIVDATTRQVTLTCSMPVHHADGTFAGVTAIDVRVTDLVREVDLPDEWAGKAKTVLVRLVDVPGSDRRAMSIIAQQDFVTDERWDVPVKSPILTSSDAQQLDGLLDDLAHQRAAFRTMSFESCQSLWAYGPLPEIGASLVVIVSCECVLTPARDAERQVLAQVGFHRRKMLGILMGAFVLVVILSVLFSRHVTRPIRELAAAVHRIADGDLDTPTRITTRDELGELGASVNAMLPQLQDRMNLKHSLTLAMEVQQHLLPQEAPRVEGLDIAGKSIYCDETGGDYYDFVDLSRIDPHTLGVAVGDVTGHGIAAALLMATARSLLRSQTDELGDLGQMLNHMNRHLAVDVPAGKFMTLSFLLVDGARQVVRWTTAGHDPAIVYTPSTDAFTELAGGGIPLGIDPSWRFEELGPQRLEPDQVIVVGTDGIWEARDPHKQMFGKQRLRDTIRAAARGSARDISEAVTEAVTKFRGVHSQDDDITLVVIKVA